MDGDEPENHVWVGDPYGDGYCCKSKNENQDCCKAAGDTWTNGTCGSCNSETQHSCTNDTDTWCCNVGQSCGNKIGVCNSCGNLSDNSCFKSNDMNSCTSEHTAICQNCGYDLVVVGVMDYNYEDSTSVYGCGGQKSCASGETWKLKSRQSMLGYGCVPDSYVACCDYRYNYNGNVIESVTSNGFVNYAPTAEDCYAEDPDIGYTAACS